MRGHPGLKVVRNEQVPIAAEGYRHLDRVLELPDITRPVQRLQELLRLGSDSLSRTALGSLTRLNGGFGQRYGEMGFANARRPEQKDIRCFADESQRAQHLPLVGLMVEKRNRTDRMSSRTADAPVATGS